MTKRSTMPRVNLHSDDGGQTFVHQEHHSRIRGEANGGDGGLLAFFLGHYREGPGADGIQAVSVSVNYKQTQEAVNQRDTKQLVTVAPRK